MKRTVSALACFAVLGAPSVVHAAGFFVGPGGAKVEQAVVTVSVVRGRREDTVFVAPQLASLASRTDHPTAYVLPVPAGATNVEFSPDVPMDMTAEPTAEIVVEREIDPCGEPAAAPVPFDPANMSHCGGLRFDPGPARHPIYLREKGVLAATAPEVAGALGVTLDADAEEAIANWTKAGARPFVLKLPPRWLRPPVARFTLPPGQLLTLPSTAPRAGGAREVVLDVYGTSRVAYGIAGAFKRPASIVKLPDGIWYADWVDGFFAQHPDGVLEELAGRRFSESDERILATLTGALPFLRVAARSELLWQEAECPVWTEPLLPTTVAMKFERGQPPWIAPTAPPALRACLLAASRSWGVSEQMVTAGKFDVELEAMAEQPSPSRPPVFVSRLRVRPTGDPLRLTTEPLRKERSSRYVWEVPWTGAITCAAPKRGRIERDHRSAYARTTFRQPAAAPPPPAVTPEPTPAASSSVRVPDAGPPSDAERAPAPARRSSSCAGLGAGWLLLLLARALRRSPTGAV